MATESVFQFVRNILLNKKLTTEDVGDTKRRKTKISFKTLEEVKYCGLRLNTRGLEFSSVFGKAQRKIFFFCILLLTNIMVLSVRNV